MNDRIESRAPVALTLAATIAAGTSAYARPVRFDAPPDYIPDGIDLTLPADQTSPGFASTEVSFYTDTSTGAPRDYAFMRIDGGTEFLTAPLHIPHYNWPQDEPFVLSYAAGETIGGGVNTGDWSQLGYVNVHERYYEWVLAGDPPDYVYGDLIDLQTSFLPTDGSTGYVGVRMSIDGATHYGWLAFELSGGINTYYATVIAWGYETEANTAIAAGAVPAPASLGMLAVGAAGALKRRKRVV